MKIWFVRHGRDDERYRGGWSRLDLTPEGVRQAGALARRLKQSGAASGADRILSSDLPRAMTTAGLLAEELCLPVVPEHRLREIDNGVLAGMPDIEARVQYPGLFFSTLEMEQAYPGGESPAAFYRRVERWLADFKAECEKGSGDVLVVTHGGVINVIYHLARGLAWSNKGPAFKTGYCSVHVMDTCSGMMEELRL